MARIPQDATHDIQRSIQDINDEFDKIEARLRSLDPSIINADIDALNAALEKVRTDIIRAKTLDFNDIFRASGPAHAIGYVPDPGPTAATSKFLREDATWAAAGGASNNSARFALSSPPAEDSYYPLMVATDAVTVVKVSVIHDGAGGMSVNAKKNHRAGDTDILGQDLASSTTWQSSSTSVSLSVGDELDVKLVGVGAPINYVVVQVDYTES